MRKALTAEECRAPSVCAGEQLPQQAHGSVGQRARRRSLCARCTRLVSQVSLRVGRRACTHAMLTHCAARSCPALAGGGMQWSLHTARTYSSTSAEPLHMVVARIAVQWFAAVRRVCHVRANARWTSCSVRVANGDVGVCPERHGSVWAVSRCRRRIGQAL